MKLRHWAAVTLLVAVSGFTSEGHACGGCFAPQQQTEPSFVTAHRMAFAVSRDRTVLWDQFEYSGAPEEFAWVLPVAPGAYLELAAQEWFDALEGLTQTIVSSPQVNCAQRDSGGCGGSSSAASDSVGYYDGPRVQVIRRANVGPYETVTLRSEDGDALTDWLVDNGYGIPPEIVPIIDAYVEEGSDFIGLKLQPGIGVERMEPVRVVTPGGDPVLPLRMVAAGVGEEVDIVLYVIAEGRYTIPDLAQREVGTSKLVWNYDEDESNYADLRRDLLREENGRTVLTSYASPEAFATRSSAGGAFIDAGAIGEYVFLSPYFEECNPSSTDLVAALLATGERVVDPCYGSAEPPVPEVSCRTPADGELGSEGFSCGSERTDLAAAMVGMRPDHVWLTRLEMRLPKEALDMDCSVERVDNTEVSRSLVAERIAGTPPCNLAVFSASVASDANGRGIFVGVLIVLGLVLRRSSWVSDSKRRA